MNVDDFEEQVWTLEGIRLVVRAARGTQIDSYDFERADSENHRISEWLANRVIPRLRGSEVIVIEGDGEEAHGKTLLRTIRQSY